jgi:rhodanese-related sulfurtransferase
MTQATDLTPLTAAEAKALVDAGKAILVDIREPNEHAQERIDGASLAPLSRIGAGMRTANNARRLAGACAGEAYVLAGGLNAWKAAGLPTA